MSSRFDALDAALSRAVLSTFGETVAATLRPWARSEFVEGEDATRPARPIRGVFTEAPSDAPLKGRATGAEFAGTTRLSVSVAEFWIAAADVAALPYQIKTGDRLELPGRPGAPRYSVSDAQTTDTGDINLILAREGCA